MNTDPERMKETQRLDGYNADRDARFLIRCAWVAVLATAGLTAFVLWGCR